MPAKLDYESTLTDRYQTTVPDAVRRALKLGKRDKIHYSILPDGKVLLSRAEFHDDDLVLENFLTFLAHDMKTHPHRIVGLDTGLVARIQALVKDVEIDLDAPLSTDDE